MPWVEGDERWLRNRLLMAQQLALTRSLTAQSPTAYALFLLIHETAAAHATAPASRANLRELREGLQRLFLVADMFERREGGRG
jgi:deoxyribodipyrimidine photolyase